MSKKFKHIACLFCVLLTLCLILPACSDKDTQNDASSKAQSSTAKSTDESSASSVSDGKYTLGGSIGWDDPVPFPDKNLEKAVRKAMHYTDKMVITRTGATYLEYLNIRGCNITNLDGLQYFTSLEVLYASDNKIKHLEALSGLVNLFALDLSDNRIVDITPLTLLTNLLFVDLYGNPDLKNVDALEAKLDVDKTYISFRHLNPPFPD